MKNFLIPLAASILILGVVGLVQPDVVFAGVSSSISLLVSANPSSGDAPLDVIYTYTATNDGGIALTDILINDDSCSPVDFVSGDDGNGIFDPSEIWIFSCNITLEETTISETFVSAVECLDPRCFDRGSVVNSNVVETTVDIAAADEKCECTDFDVNPKRKANPDARFNKKFPQIPDDIVTLTLSGDKKTFTFKDTKNWETKLNCSEGTNNQCSGFVELKAINAIVTTGKPDATFTPKLVPVGKPLTFAGTIRCDSDNCKNPTNDEFSTEYTITGETKKSIFTKDIKIEYTYEVEWQCGLDGKKKNAKMSVVYFFKFRPANQDHMLMVEQSWIHSNWDGDKKKNTSEKSDKQWDNGWEL